LRRIGGEKFEVIISLTHKAAYPILPPSKSNFLYTGFRKAGEIRHPRVCDLPGGGFGKRLSKNFRKMGKGGKKWKLSKN
jgi:hypothetical protein